MQRTKVEVRPLAGNGPPRRSTSKQLRSYHTHPGPSTSLFMYAGRPMIERTRQGSNHPRGADDPLAVARDLLQRGIMPLPLKPGMKNPNIRNWQHLNITTENVTQYFDGGIFNVGGRMGAKSGGL